MARYPGRAALRGRETLLSLLGFAVAASIAPGPDMLLVAAMSAAGGLRGAGTRKAAPRLAGSPLA